MDQHMITTSDNPYDPFTEFDQWYTWDRTAGYNSLSYLDRVVKTSYELSQADQSLANEQAIDDIVNEHAGLYKKVTRTAETTI